MDPIFKTYVVTLLRLYASSRESQLEKNNHFEYSIISLYIVSIVALQRGQTRGLSLLITTTKTKTRQLITSYDKESGERHKSAGK